MRHSLNGHEQKYNLHPIPEGRPEIPGTSPGGTHGYDLDKFDTSYYDWTTVNSTDSTAFHYNVIRHPPRRTFNAPEDTDTSQQIAPSGSAK